MRRGGDGVAPGAKADEELPSERDIEPAVEFIEVSVASVESHTHLIAAEDCVARTAIAQEEHFDEGAPGDENESEGEGGGERGEFHLSCTAERRMTSGITRLQVLIAQA